MNVLSLFAGIGGLELGLERAGMTVVGQVEIDPWCRKVLAKHWPEVPRHDDVRTCVDWWRSEPRPAVHVVAGGYPCQPESLAGQGLSTDDERWLWPEMARVIHAVRPRFVIGENVMGHRTRGLRFVLRDLERLGYRATAGTLAASEVGAPHARRRIFVIAELADADGDLWRVQPRRRGGEDGEGSPIPRDDGPTQPLADTSSDGGGQGWPGRSARRGEDGPAVPSARLAGAGPNAIGEGRNPWRADARSEGATSGEDADGTESSRGIGRSTEPALCRMADGIPGGLDRGGLDANAEEGGSATGLPTLRNAADSAAVRQRQARGPGRLPAPDILRPSVHGVRVPQRRPVHDLPAEVLEECMRVVREHGADRRAPHGRGQDEQLAHQLADAVSPLPHGVALAERQAVLEEAQSYVHGLREGCEALGVMRDPSEPLPAAWLALSREAQDWVRLAACGGPWVAEWPDTPRIAYGARGKVDRLRGLGNAVVPQVAEYVGRLITGVAA